MNRKYPKSPLRYPGGKNKAVRDILAYIPKNITELCSPFLGGGSIELACTKKGIKVFAYDIFSILVDFWEVLLESPDKLANEVQKFLPLTKTEFYNLQRICLSIENKLNRAVAFFTLNRCSFSGTTLSGGMSPGHPRFTQAAIDNLKNFEITNFYPGCLDYKNVLKKHKDTFLYLDPPYANGRKLYGDKGGLHMEFNHRDLAKNLHKRDRWLLSYNDCNLIRELYANYQFIDLSWKYGMNQSKKSNEVLIVSMDLSRKFRTGGVK
jgi:DNA adenine methylase